MQLVTVEIPGTEQQNYPIYIGNNLIGAAGNLLKEVLRAEKLLVLSNKTVFAFYGEQLVQSFEQEGFEVFFLLIEEGEEYKNVKSLEQIWTRAIELKFERRDAFIALGGGVIGDITGFAAATYLRGIDYIQVPTTLLAQVDSSVGGKVAVNHPLGKNLIGNFYQPRAVISDIGVLSSLPAHEVRVGLAEVLKYGFIEKTCGLQGFGVPFIDYLEENREITPELVKYCCELKASVVNKDEKEAGFRAILNFGHTIGHAVEKCAGYQGINHGQAVAIGMQGAFLLGRNKLLIDRDYCEKALNLLDDYKMNCKIYNYISPDDLYEAMLVDKKVDSGKIRFVLPVGRGEVGIFSDVTKKEVIDVLNCLY